MSQELQHHLAWASIPRLVQADADRRFHACQGTVLHVELEGAHRLLHGRDPAGPPTLERAEALQRLYQHLIETILAFGGDVLELRPEAVVGFFPDAQPSEQGVLQALAAASTLREWFRTESCAGGPAGTGTASAGGSAGGPAPSGTAAPPRAARTGAVGSASSTREDPAGSGVLEPSARFGITTGVFHGLLLGRRELGRLVSFSGATLEEARRMALQADPLGISIHPASGVRLQPDAVRTEPPLPTPSVSQLVGLEVSVGQLAPPPWAPPRQSPTFLAPTQRRLIERSGRLEPVVRRLCVLSVAASSLDPASPNGLEALSAWLERLQALVVEREGEVTRLEVGAPTILEAVFGLERDRPDEEARALKAALALQRSARDLPSLSDQRIGVATGDMVVGWWGAEQRRSMMVLGARVEACERLVTLAGPWEVLADRHAVSRSGFGFDWGPPPATFTGAEPELATCRVLYGEGAYGAKLTSRSRGNLIGRETLMASLRDYADQAFAGRGGAISLVGTAGIGKSALVVWLGQHLQDTKRIPVYRGECSALVRNTPYHAWVPVFRDWLDLESNLPIPDQVSRISERIGSLGADLLPRLPLIGLVTGIDIPDNATTSGLDARSRTSILQSTIVELLRRAHQNHPMGILLEDAHWMDEASVGLLRYLARNISELPILMVISRRTQEAGQDHLLQTLASMPAVTELEVGPLREDALFALACRHIGASRLSPRLADLLRERSDGTPLFLEELTLWLRDSEQILVGADGMADLVGQSTQHLPRSLKEVILSRVSRLDEGAQMTLRTASAIGRTFSLSLLQEVYPVPFDYSVLIGRLERVEGLDIVRQENAAAEQSGSQSGRSESVGEGRDQAFFFKHALICDTIYETITASARRSLHESIGQALERRLTPRNRTELVPSIAEHYRRSTRTDKQRVYFKEAGLLARDRGLNKEAYELFFAVENLYQLIGDRASACDLLTLEVAALNSMGARDLEREAIHRWKEAARELDDEVRLTDALAAEGSLFATEGEGVKSFRVLERARRMARTREAATQEARILRIISRLHMQQGNLHLALEAAQSALALSVGTGDWQEMVMGEGNVGLFLAQLNQVQEGREKLQRALALAQEHGDLRRVGSLLYNLGVLDHQDGRYDKAIRLWERALALRRQVGERRAEIEALTSLGATWAMLGSLEVSRQFCEEALSLARQTENAWLEAHSLANLARSHASLEQFDEAQLHFEQALELAQRIKNLSLQVEAIEGMLQLYLGCDMMEALQRLLDSSLTLVPDHTGFRVYRAVALSRRGEHAEAETEASVVLRGLEEGQETHPPPYYLRYLLSTVFVHIDPTRSSRLLQESRAELILKVQKIQDPQLRELMLTKVPENLAIINAWRELESSIET